ncbi:NAD-dependent epimerase/dehydratase family protein [Mucilaginibacter sp. UR6-1]|uniref:NAD-dependent epimerase/dehydratase family protein n=1 Tax=Mucilaginibacter sp. UR6-1 TaxID=1435643 RepID=UPI001E34FC4A|nr:NAD-dependent epimerase/dehydratase family protein [Mucilaginibacter sp. UR6-1]MCC8409752.1 NAD-dependent epimerase/dehydratase family protein [Mucilaginibacter sp. UR6-1]
MHTILGAGGPVANTLTRQLIDHNQNVKLVSRRPSTFTGNNVSWQKADLLNRNEVLNAVKGSTVIYLCAGLVYDKDIWREQWPVIIQNVIDAAKETQARLIFFDNVYMYGLVNGAMTENTHYNPTSVKGEVRAKVATTLMDEAKAGNIKASILRGADFYGAESMNSFYDMMVLDKFSKRQKAQWIGDANTKHSFTYVPDAGQAMYLLGQTPESDNQIWHAPSAPALTGKQLIELAAGEFGVAPKFTSINKAMLWMVGLFNKTVMGTVEMYYQYDHDYIFDSSKFEKAFGIKPTTYRDGISHLAQTQFKR